MTIESSATVSFPKLVLPSSPSAWVGSNPHRPSVGLASRLAMSREDWKPFRFSRSSCSPDLWAIRTFSTATAGGDQRWGTRRPRGLTSGLGRRA